MTRPLLFLLAAAAAFPAAGPDFDGVEREHARLSARAEDGVRELAVLRAAFPGADPESQLAAWREREKAFDAYQYESGELFGRYDAWLRAEILLVAADGLSKAAKRRATDSAAGDAVARHREAHTRMRSRAERVQSAHRDQQAAFYPLRDSYLSERAALRRTAWYAAAAALLLVLGAAVYARGGPRPPPADEPAPAEVAGNFTVVRRLGGGSAGEVFEAVDRTLQRPVALKRLSRELKADPRGLESLLAEARLLAGLKHPHMTALYGVEREGGEVYLALEYMEGGTLAERLKADGPLTWAEALRVLTAAAAAVDYCHANKVIHRALKPGHVMFGAEGAVKVTDFALAYRAAESVSRLTRQASWGAPAYMSPEQELGELSGAADVYALAACFYESLTGAPAFPGPDFLAQKRAAAWTPPSRLAPALPAGADALFARALSPDPARRFPTGTSLAAAAASLR